MFILSCSSLFHFTLSCMFLSTLECRALCDSDADFHRQGQWDGAKDRVSSCARERGGPHARRMAEVLLPGHQTDIWLWRTTLLSSDSSPWLFWLIYFFFPLYKWAPGMWLYWKTDIAPCSTFLFLVSVFKRKIQKSEKIDRYYDWHGETKSLLFLFTHHLHMCKRHFYCIAVWSTFGTLTSWPCLDRGRLDSCLLFGLRV